MAYVVENYEQQLTDALSEPENWTRRSPVYARMFDSIADMRSGHEERGTSIKTPEWKLVARMQTTLESALGIMSNGGFIKDKKAFYSWLKRNPAYLTYDARFGR